MQFPVSKEVKEKFEKAWERGENLEDIKREIRENVMKTLVKKLKEKYLTLYEDEFLSGEKSKPLFIFGGRYIESLDIAYAIESDKPYFLKLKYGIKADDCDEFYPKENVIHLSVPEEIQKKYLEKYYSNTYKNIDEYINEMKEVAKSIAKDWKEEQCWFLRRYFDSYYGDTSKKEFYLEVLEKGYDNVADYYYRQIDRLIFETENYLHVLSEIND